MPVNYCKRYVWTGIFLICLSHLWMDFMLGIWPVYKTLASLDLVVAGLIASLAMLVGEGLQLYFGFLSDKGFHQKLIAWGIGLTSIVSLMCYTDNTWILFVCVLAVYIGSGAFHPAATGLLIGWHSSSKNFLISLFACVGTIGAGLSQFGFMHIYHYMEGHTWVLAIPILILTLGCSLFRFPKLQPKNQIIKFKEIIQIIKPYRFELSFLYLIQLCLQIIVLSFNFLLPDILQAKGYETWFCLGGGYFYFILGAAMTSIPIGYGVEKFGYKWMLAGIIVTSAFSMHLFLGYTLTFWSAVILLFCLGSTLGVIIPVAVAGGNSIVPPQASGFVSALYMGGVSCLAGVGPIASSLITTRWTQNSPVSALQLLSSLFILALGLLVFIPHSVQKQAIKQDSKILI